MPACSRCGSPRTTAAPASGWPKPHWSSRSSGAAEGERVVGGINRQEEPLLVEHLGAIDVLVAVDDDGLWEVDRSRLSARPVAWPLDPLTPVHVAGGQHGPLEAPPDGGGRNTP